MRSQGVLACSLQVVPSPRCQGKPQLLFALTQVRVACCYDSADLKFPPLSFLTFILTSHLKFSNTHKGHWGFLAVIVFDITWISQILYKCPADCARSSSGGWVNNVHCWPPGRICSSVAELQNLMIFGWRSRICNFSKGPRWLLIMFTSEILVSKRFRSVPF